MLTIPDIRRSYPDAAAAISNRRDETSSETIVRDIHAVTPPPRPLPPPPLLRGYFSPSTSSQTQTSSSENFTSITREFNALVLAGTSAENNQHDRYITNENERRDLTRIGEEREENGRDNGDHQQGGDNGGDNGDRQEREENGGDNGDEEEQVGEVETNPLAMAISDSGSGQETGRVGILRSTASVETVRREEVEAKITAWQTAKVAKINNRFKRQDAVINGWINEKIHKANSWMKKVERKLEKKKAKAMEKMENDVAKAERRAAERKATAEAKRGAEVAKVIEEANLMRTVGRPPPKRFCFFF